MPRHYQLKRKNPFSLPHNIYMQMIYIVRDYDRMRLERHKLPEKLAELADARVQAIDMAIEAIPPEYRKNVFRYVAYGDPFPYIAGIATWKRQQQKFVWHVAHLLGEV